MRRAVHKPFVRTITAVRPALGLVAALLAGHAHAHAAKADGAYTSDAEPRHHLSVVVAGTHIDAADETAFTLGLDYEYQVSENLGVGTVVEQAFGAVDSTTVLAVADIHLWRGLAVQVGPGVEFVDDSEFALGRLGAVYEFELGDHLTAAPQMHYDMSEGEDAVVFGVAVGRAF